LAKFFSFLIIDEFKSKSGEHQLTCKCSRLQPPRNSSFGPLQFVTIYFWKIPSSLLSNQHAKDTQQTEFTSYTSSFTPVWLSRWGGKRENSSVFHTSIGLAYQVENLVFTPESRLEIEEFREEESHDVGMGVAIHPQSH